MESLYILNAKAEVDSMKRRELALLYALQGIEKERSKMLALLYDANRCADCISLNECKRKSHIETAYKVKKRRPETFCAMWEYAGPYTPFNEIMILARQASGKEE